MINNSFGYLEFLGDIFIENIDYVLSRDAINIKCDFKKPMNSLLTQ